MKSPVQRNLIFSAVLVILLVGCTYTGTVRAVDQEEMSKLESNVILLTIKVDDLYRTNKIPTGADDKTILGLATEKDQNVRDALKEYAARFKVESGHAVVLICTKDQKQALVEMSACSIGPDSKPWKSNGCVPCQFTLDEKYTQGICSVGQ
jgi:hypothetical protein